jgi:hypothetical protein
MAELTEEQFKELPEFLSSAYVKDGDGYTHGGFLKVKSTANDLDAKSKSTTAELEEYRSKEKERTDAIALEAYEKAKKEGNVEEIEKRYLEQLEDAKNRYTEEGKISALRDFKEQQAVEKADSIALRISADIAADEFARDLIQTNIKAKIKVDPETGKHFYLDANGSATALDDAAFKSELLKSPHLQRLIKADLSVTGGGLVNGSSAGSASSSTKNTAAEIARKNSDLDGFIKASLKVR